MNNLSTAARFIFFAAAFVIVVAGIKAAEPLLVPFLLSVFIALICSPLLVWLKARRVPSALAIVLIVLGFFNPRVSRRFAGISGTLTGNEQCFTAVVSGQRDQF